MFTESELEIVRSILLENDSHYEMDDEFDDEFESRKKHLYWYLHRENIIDLSQIPYFWHSAAEASSDYDANDVVQILTKSSQNDQLFESWRQPEPACFVENVSGDLQPLVEALPKLHESFKSEMKFQLAVRGAIDVKDLDEALLLSKAEEVVENRRYHYHSVLDDMLAVWSEEEVCKSINRVASKLGAKLNDFDFLDKTLAFITPEQLVNIAFNTYYSSDIKDIHKYMNQRPEGLAELIIKTAPNCTESTGLVATLGWLALQLREKGESLDYALADHMMASASCSDIEKLPQLLSILPEDLSEKFVLDNLFRSSFLRYFCNKPVAVAMVERVCDCGRGEHYFKVSAIEAIGKKYPETLIAALETKKIPQRALLVEGLAASVDPIAIPTLITYLEDTVETVRTEAVKGLKKHGMNAIDALLSALDSRKKTVRLHVCEILMTLDETTKSDPRIVEKAAEKAKKEKVEEIRLLLTQLGGVEDTAGADANSQANVALAAVSQQEHKSLMEATKKWQKLHREYWYDSHDENDKRAYQDFSQLMSKTCGDRAVIVAAKGLGETNYTASVQCQMLATLAGDNANNEVNAHACLIYWCEKLKVISAPRNREYGDSIRSSVNYLFANLCEFYGSNLHQAMRSMLIEAKHPVLDAVWERYMQLNRDDVEDVFLSFSKVASAESLLSGMKAFPATALPVLLDLLKAKKVASRSNAAQVFMECPTLDALPALETALSKEKNAKVKGLLAYATFSVANLEFGLSEKLASKHALTAAEHTELDAFLERFVIPLPKKVELTALPRLLWASGKQLSDGAMQWFISRLAEESAKQHDPILVNFVAQLHRDELKPLWQSLLSIYAGEKEARLGWVLFSAALLGDDEVMSELGKNLDDEARSGASAAAFYKVQILARHGSQSALSWLDHWTRKAKSQGLKHRTINALDDIAAEKGISRDEIADSVASDLGFNDQGQQNFAFGERTLLLTLQDDGAITLSLDGKTLKSAPATRKSDDADELKQRRSELSAYRKQIKQAFANAQARLEQAMITGRIFNQRIFSQTWGSNALLAYLARRVVWCFSTESEDIYVRLDESNQFVDINDDEVVWPEGATLTVMHPLNSTSEICQQWQEIFDDYEIEPPFPQLARLVFTVPDDEKSLRSVKRYKKTTFSTSRLRTKMERRGWANGEPQDAGNVNWLYKYFASANITVAIHMSEGFCMGHDDFEPEQKIPAIDFHGKRYGRDIPYQAERITLRDVDAIVYSETIADLESVLSNN
ncbi:DUF4132 domain-containing protein [Vibrio sp. Of7-15]|uniref:DUF4132 domain-containing protein n=1 Tax=Vibrio sp. Of7-15 TaxID=2724879 RepID=UPI001EF17F86|nr:DUF4132 domain-containing protein [Vibrio sp. Of7-15]MCG7497481.1 DUF4132 domain-containing protein [Vibrio sp. Of7-15]